ncbi:MAG: YfhO family protein [bacterium]
METKTFWLGLLVLVLVFTFYPLWQGKFYAVGDMRDVFIPLETFFRQEMLAFRLPSWNPDIAWGFPVIASAQIGFFYPPLLLLRLFPPWLYIPLILLGHLAALAIGTFFFFRALKITHAGSYFGSINYTLGSFIIQHLSHLNIIITTAWLPWQLLAVHKITARPRLAIRQIIILSLVFGLPFLAGQLQIPAMMAIVSAAYFFYLRFQQRKNIFRPVLLLLLIAALSFLIAAAQLLPTLELITQSSRGPSGDFDIQQANQYSFPLYHLPTLIWPRFYGNDSTYWGARLQVEQGIFIGSIPLILALWFIVTRISRHINRFWLFLLIISFFLALGSLSPFRLLGLEPSLWVFSAPARWLLFTTFSLSLFAARGLDLAPKHTCSLRRFAFFGAIIITAIALIGTLVLFTADDSLLKNLAANAFWGNLNRLPDYYTEKLNSLINSARSSSFSLAAPAAALPVIFLSALPFILTRRRCLPVILAITTVELVIIAATTIPATSWNNILTPPDTIAALPAVVLEKQARIFSFRPPGDTGQYFSNPETRPDAKTRAQLRTLLTPLSHAIYHLPGIEWPASLHLAYHADVLDSIRSSDSQWLKDVNRAEQLNIGAVLVPANDGVSIYQLSPAPRASTQGASTYQTISPTHTRISVDVPADAALTIRDSYYPGWRAYIDDVRTPIAQADAIFRQLAIPAGRHQVDMYYRPLALYLGLVLSALTITFSAVVILKSERI